MTQKCKHIFPLDNITIRKVKSIKRPKVDMNQLEEMYGPNQQLAGKKILKKEEEQEVKEN